jgi:trehalose 6-phosphate synthase
VTQVADPRARRAAIPRPIAPTGGHDFVVVAHRLPVQATANRWTPVPGSLASTLHPVTAARRGGWIGWSGVPDGPTRPIHVNDVWLHPIALSDTEATAFLAGHCESTIAPLYHDAVVAPVFDREWRDTYRSVNERYAAVAARLATPGGVVWVHDYHLQLVPAMLRRLRPDLLIGFYLHTPFPALEMFRQMPLREEILAGLLGADLIGLQSPRDVGNLLGTAATLLGIRVDEGSARIDGRRVHVGAFPQSVDVEAMAKVAATPGTRARAAELRAGLGHPRRVLLAVDRLHPAKGIEERLTAYDGLLAAGDLDPTDTVLVQVVAPDQQPTGSTRQLRERIEHQVGQLNGRYGRVGRSVVHYLHRNLDAEELAALYLAADILLATPLRDGMNLTAKEYVAARYDCAGAVVLSEFTATAADLPEAFIVNPRDVDAVREAIRAAATARPAELRHRMAAMHARIRGHDVRHWAGGLLASLGEAVAAAALPPS